MRDLAITAAQTAGQILMRNFGKLDRFNRKEEHELVSSVDIESENRIIELIRARYPDHNILCEESKWEDTDSKYKWIIDPLDGTHNYIYGIGIFGVSIALEHDGEIVLGVVNLPYFNEIFWAEKGKGAYLNGDPVRVSERTMKDALAFFDSGLRTNTAERAGFLSLLVGKIFNVRMLGSSVRHLTYVASGKADLIVEFGDRPWDFAAGGLILEEAGGRITTLDGSKWSPYIQGYIASNGKFHDEVVKLLRSFRQMR